MTINGFYLFPHPPIVVPEVGKGEEKKIQSTYNSMDSLAREISHKTPKTIIIISPHGSMFRDAISLLYGDSIAGSLGQFGAANVEFKNKINLGLTEKIYDLAMKNEIPVIKADIDLLKSYNNSFQLDHGAMVPLYFIDKYYKDYNLVHITYAPLSDEKLYEFGKVIFEASKDWDTIIIASGDLSHRLKEDGPYGYNPDGPRFDKKILDLLKLGDVDSLMNFNKDIIENAGECGMRSILILIGAMDGLSFKGDLLSYEDTFGVGYGVMKFHMSQASEENPFVRLAKDNLTHFLNTGSPIENIPSYVTEEMKKQRKGVFVTLYKGENLRGCIGTIFPTTDSIYEEIIRNSIQAGIYDPRFSSVGKDELEYIQFSVDILDSPEPATIEDLDPTQYGIILSTRNKKALLLPNLEGVDTVEKQIQITKGKAGIRSNEDFLIERFKVTRYEENSNA